MTTYRLLTALLSAAFCLAGLVRPARAALPNFVIILADDLGYGDLSTYGGWIEVPNLDRMAAEGMRFTDFHSNGAVCSPTRAALMTGRYQQRAGIPGVVYADPQRPVHRDGLQERDVTFAQLLREHGYATGMFGKWHLGYEVQYNPSLRGFGVFRGYVSGNVDYFSHVDQAGAFDWWKDVKKADEIGYSTHLITRHAVQFIRDHRDGPFCLYVPHEAPHAPYQGPGDDPKGFRIAGQHVPNPELSREQIRRRYREMVVEMDKGVGEILETLATLGLEKNTFVLFFSDNGATRQGDNHPLRGTKGTVWEGGHRVPAIARWPGKIPAGSETDQLAMGFDVMPTLLDLAGVDAPAGRRLDGVSLTPVLLRGESIARGPLFWQYGKAVAMRDGAWKLVLGQKGLEGPGLFQLTGDIGERRNLAGEHPDLVGRMSKAIERWRRDVAKTATAQPSGEKLSSH